jgi:formamidopyrimidine-DNA glycosylase
MPELPEVETIRLGLEQYVIGKTIKSVEVRLRRIFYGEEKELIGAKFISVQRFGKVLSLNLNNNLSIVVHVKMTGQLIYEDKETKRLPHKFTHIIFHLDKGTLYYNDIRQFGWLKITPTEKVNEHSLIKNMGPEPLKDLTLDKFKNILQKSKTKVKVVLMDQSKIAGIGNIYANDALYLSKIDPRRSASSLVDMELKELYNAIETVLRKGIKHGGSSENTYVNALGEKGSYQEHALVYGKTGEVCKTCGTKIQRITIGGRGTFICPNCQK